MRGPVEGLRRPPRLFPLRLQQRQHAERLRRSDRGHGCARHPAQSGGLRAVGYTRRQRARHAGRDSRLDGPNVHSEPRCGGGLGQSAAGYRFACSAKIGLRRRLRPLPVSASHQAGNTARRTVNCVGRQLYGLGPLPALRPAWRFTPRHARRAHLHFKYSRQSWSRWGAAARDERRTFITAVLRERVERLAGVLNAFQQCRDALHDRTRRPRAICIALDGAQKRCRLIDHDTVMLRFMTDQSMRNLSMSLRHRVGGVY